MARRKELDEKYPFEIEPLLEPGDYAKSIHGLWVLRAPNGDMGSLRPTVHQIVEHENGDITVSPSIQFETGKRWHGYLKNGTWSE